MNEYIKQHVFSTNNTHLFYLCPYTEVIKMEDRIILIRQESDKAVALPADKEESFCLIEMLKNGIEEIELKQKLLNIFRETGEDWMHSCIWEGIIE